MVIAYDLILWFYMLLLLSEYFLELLLHGRYISGPDPSSIFHLKILGCKKNQIGMKVHEQGCFVATKIFRIGISKLRLYIILHDYKVVNWNVF